MPHQGGEAVNRRFISYHQVISITIHFHYALDQVRTAGIRLNFGHIYTTMLQQAYIFITAAS